MDLDYNRVMENFQIDNKLVDDFYREEKSRLIKLYTTSNLTIYSTDNYQHTWIYSLVGKIEFDDVVRISVPYEYWEKMPTLSRYFVHKMKQTELWSFHNLNENTIEGLEWLEEKNYQYLEECLEILSRKRIAEMEIFDNTYFSNVDEDKLVKRIAQIIARGRLLDDWKTGKVGI